MEYLFAALVLGAVIGFAVLVAVNIERGRTWAVEMALAIATLEDSRAATRFYADDVEPEVAAETEEVEVEERLAA